MSYRGEPETRQNRFPTCCDKQSRELVPPSDAAKMDIEVEGFAALGFTGVEMHDRARSGSRTE